MKQAILDLGCGERKLPEAIGMDRVRLPAVDVVHDLDVFPYPFETNQFERIRLRHVAEHVTDVVRLMEEIHRIGRAGCRVEIFSPHFTSLNSYADPTHKHHFSLLTFDLFCGKTEHPHMHKTGFRLLERHVEFWSLHERLGIVPYHWLGIKRLVENHPAFYERFLAFLFPMKEFSIVLEIVK